MSPADRRWRPAYGPEAERIYRADCQACIAWEAGPSLPAIKKWAKAHLREEHDIDYDDSPYVMVARVLGNVA